MSESKEKVMWAPCKRCNIKTIHNILATHSKSGDEDYHYSIEYNIISCKGCDTASFREVFHDIESAYPNKYNEWEVPKTYDYYPRILKQHHDISGLRHVPELVNEIYEETLTAIKENACVLAGLGLRGTIEAVCNEKNIKGKNLEIRISKLAQRGLISQKDAERLHAIRFLGNDAAHEIKKPNEKQLNIALKIVEHMIVTVYVLDEEAKGNLETVVTAYSDFIKILDARIKEHQINDELPLAKYLGKDIRRINGGITPMESQLISNIESGAYTKLKLGKVDNYMQSPTRLQYFVYTG